MKSYQADIQEIFVLQLYLAPITNSRRYQDSVYFWRDVYGIKSEFIVLCLSLYTSIDSQNEETELVACS